MPLPPKRAERTWCVPDIEIVFTEGSLSVAAFEPCHNSKKKNKDEQEPEVLLFGEFIAPIVLNNASWWRFNDDAKKKPQTRSSFRFKRLDLQNLNFAEKFGYLERCASALAARVY